jgi:hypothetical protein
VSFFLSFFLFFRFFFRFFSKVIFGPGTYALDFVLTKNGLATGTILSGTAGNPITFTSNWNGVAADRPIIASDTTSNSQSLGTFNIMKDAKYITIDGLHIKHSTSGAVAAANCGLRVWGGIWFEGGANNIIIKNNEIESITGTGIQMNNARATTPLSFVTIENNWIHDLGTATGCSSNGGYGIWSGKKKRVQSPSHWTATVFPVGVCSS